MSEYVRYNLNSYLNKTGSKKNGLCILLVLSLLSLILFSLFYKIEKRIEVNAKTICDNESCTLYFYKKLEEDIKEKTVKIENLTYEIENISLNEIELNSTNEAYQETTLKLKDYEGKNNEVVKLKFVEQNETLFTRIYKIIKER